MGKYERCLATRNFWDDSGHEWSKRTLDEKLVILAGFVQGGGSLKRVIENYADDRSEIYRSRIHWVIFDYIWRMMMVDVSLFDGRVTADRIKCLNNDELIRLLEGELKMCVKKTCWSGFDYKGEHEIVDCWIVSDEYKYDDTVLDQIEREHWRAHPEETITHYWNMAKRWDRQYCLY